ncbi:hypothetical protein GGR57DRAFT_519722 [Xylariaceae sp. FL1272]|nr:hypothetical protein GGR57DRAFT_519722 [Xylariaceae sp. FL1272]
MILGDILQVQSDRWSEPVPGANGRRNKLWAVEGIGGASRMNAMLWTRGYPGDYAAWAEMGLEDWSYEKLEPYFRRIENAICHPSSNLRGHSGPVELRQYKYPFRWTTYIPVMLELPRNETFHLLQSIWGVWHLLLWLLFGKGFIGYTALTTSLFLHSSAIDKKTMCVQANNGVDGSGNLDSSQPQNIPDIEIMIMPNSSVERAARLSEK